VSTLVASGSVKDIYRWPGEVTAALQFQFSDRYSVFDWGAMPQTITGKGEALAWIAAALFERLEDSGVRTHYLGITSEEMNWKGPVPQLSGRATGIVVDEVEIANPTWNEQDSSFAYPKRAGASRTRLVPLEVVFRHSLTVGSSLLERRSDLQAGQSFNPPLVEFFTKLEPRDRWLSEEDARAVADLSEAELERLRALTIRVAGLLRDWFSEAGLRLIDGKLEWAMTPQGEFVLVDAIGPDELRLETSRGIEVSKEAFRKFFRSTEWYRRIREVKKQLEQEGREDPDWQNRVGMDPPLLPNRVVEGFVEALRGLANSLCAREVFPGASLQRAESSLALDCSLELAQGRVLLLGSGGREHALAWKMAQSPMVREILWHGAGDVVLARMRQEFPSIRLRAWGSAATSASELARQAREAAVDFVVIGPDEFLADGFANAFEEVGLRVFGPRREAARIEWSKSFSKEVMHAAGVPTARSLTVSTVDELFLRVDASEFGAPWVVKADGLALGKGVQVCHTRDEALEFGSSWLRQGQTLVIEEFLNGRESSWFAFCDGEQASLLEPARDYKTIFEGGLGPNTGGMGAVSPPEDLPTGMTDRVRREVFEPVLREMKRRGAPFRGLLYAGLMISEDRYGVLEFNARFGDPEAQVLLPRMSDDIVPWMLACATGRLAEFPRDVSFDRQPGCFVVAAAAGYPGRPEKGDAITGMEQSGLFLSGVAGSLESPLSAGGRVLGVLGRGATLAEARALAYAKLSQLQFRGMQVRHDVGAPIEKKSIVVLASGRGSNFVAIAEAARSPVYPARIAALLSNRPNAPALERAREFGIESQACGDEKALLESILEHRPALVALAGYMKLLSSRFLGTLREHGIPVLNIHPSFLPEFRGLNAYGRAFEAGLMETGVTVHEVVEELDAGPILAQERFSIAGLGSVEEVERRGLQVEHQLYPRVIARVLTDLSREGDPA
jgi:phosphoribosylamine--glycine ligase